MSEWIDQEQKTSKFLHNQYILKYWDPSKILGLNEL